MTLAASSHEDRWRVALRRPEETQALLAVWVASWRATYADIAFEARCPWLLDHLAELEAQGAQTLCLWEDAPLFLAGFVVIDPKTGWLDQLCVHPERFGAGVAETLIAAARARAPGCVRLDVNADNARALRFYQREGFRRMGESAPSKSGRPTLVLEWRAKDAEAR